jgi:hypothetical protein
MALCLSVKFLLEYSMCEIFFNSGSDRMEKFSNNNFEVIDNLIFITQVSTPMILIHLYAKTKYFKMKI